jgi:hypothetical protein
MSGCMAPVIACIKNNLLPTHASYSSLYNDLLDIFLHGCYNNLCDNQSITIYSTVGSYITYLIYRLISFCSFYHILRVDYGSFLYSSPSTVRNENIESHPYSN